MIGSSRRCVLAAVSVTLAFGLLRPYVADMMCARGDEFLRSGDPRTAQVYYRRAIVVDPTREPAVERFIFASLEIRSTQSLANGTNVADAFLTRHPEDAAVRVDRALILWAERSPRAAKELAAIDSSLHDARFTRLAAIASHGRAIRRP